MPGDPVLVPLRVPEVPLDEFHPGISMQHRIFRFQILMTRQVMHLFLSVAFGCPYRIGRHNSLPSALSSQRSAETGASKDTTY